MSPKGRSFIFFDIVQQTGFSKSPKSPPSTILKTLRFLSLGHCGIFQNLLQAVRHWFVSCKTMRSKSQRGDVINANFWFINTVDSSVLLVGAFINISALAGILLKSGSVYFFFRTIFRTIWIIQIFCSDVIEMKRANVRNCAVVAPSYWDEANEC